LAPGLNNAWHVVPSKQEQQVSRLQQQSGVIAPRRVAIVVRDGMDYALFTRTLREMERDDKAEIYVLGLRLGSVRCDNGNRVAVDATLRRWPGTRFDMVCVMHARDARTMKSALIEEVFVRAAQCAGATIQHVATPVPAATSRPQFGLTVLARLLVPSLLLGAISLPARALDLPSLPPVLVDPAATASPYAVDGSGALVRSNTEQCWRTGSWSVEGAASTKVVGSDFPVGCYCDKDLMPKGTCEPKVAAVTPPPAPAPAPQPAPAPLVPDKVSVPADALFAFDKATLTSAGRTQLSTFADKLKALNLESVVAVGHTDRIGTEAYNQKLSERRAAAVRSFLIEQGVPADKVFSEGRGESQPVTGDQCQKMGRENAANHKLVACLAPDRRVEVEAVGVRR
jgi:OOP family OmpA-OmpF porin